MEHQSRELAMTLVEVAEILSSTLDRAEVLDRILTQLVRVVAYDNATVMLIEDDRLVPVAQRGLSAELDVLPVLDVECFEHVHKVIREHHPVIMADTNEDQRWQTLSIISEARCWLGVPLTVHDAVIGLLNLGKVEAGFYTPEHAQFALAFAQQAAIAIDNARLYEQARRDAEMKTILLREVNHRVKNNLASIIGLLYTEQHYLDDHGDGGADDFVERMVNRVQGLALVHTMLSDSSWEPLPLDHLAYRIIYNVLQMTSSTSVINVEISSSPADASAEGASAEGASAEGASAEGASAEEASAAEAPVTVNFKQAYDLALVFNELATNTAKHGVDGRDSVTITVEISHDAPWIEICFRNDGPDYPGHALAKDTRNIGLHLVDTIVHHNLHGDLSLENDNGAVARIRFQADDTPPIALLTLS
jgi:two-component sensor histidine kinase